jgi:hypothetical protein
MWKSCLEQELANSCHLLRCNWAPSCTQSWAQGIWRTQGMEGISLCEGKMMPLGTLGTLEEQPLTLRCINLLDQEESCEQEFQRAKSCYIDY